MGNIGILGGGNGGISVPPVLDGVVHLNTSHDVVIRPANLKKVNSDLCRSDIARSGIDRHELLQAATDRVVGGEQIKCATGGNIGQVVLHPSGIEIALHDPQAEARRSMQGNV